MRTLIEHCTLIDVVRDRPTPDAWILIQDKHIAAIGYHGEQCPIQPDQVLDAQGCSLLPGLFNLHVHIQRRHLSQPNTGNTFKSGAPAVENAPDPLRMIHAVKNAWREIQGGVTTIRNCGSKNRIDIDLRNAIDEGVIQGPTVLACGFGIAATGGHETHKYQGAVEVDGPDAFRKAVRTEIKAGADLIKFMGSGGIGSMPEKENPNWVEIGIDELEAGILEAHNRGRKTTVHAMGKGAIHNALKAGIDCIEHGVMLDDEALDLMCSRGVDYVPTLSGICAVADRERKAGKTETADLIDSIVIEPLKASIRQAYARGITIGCGTDTLGDVVDELKLFHQCGIPEMDCLRTATVHAARICGLEKALGTLEKGKTADLLLVKGNPLQDLEILRNVHTVWKGGQAVGRDWLLNLQGGST